jgi:uncharacterized RDD family membrane protein YckC
MNTGSADGGKPDDPLPELPPICGFWVRLLALLIDCVLLGVLGLLLGALFGRQFCDFWPLGRLVGYSIVLAYFGVLESSVGKGQSLGKKILKIRVVNRDGDCISPLRSLARAIILETPLFLSQDYWPLSISGSVPGLILNFVLLVVGGGTIYLCAFNRRTRQGIHDLAVGTYVRRASTTGTVVAPPIATVHLVLFGTWCLVALAYSASLSPWLWQGAEFADMLALERALLATNKMYAAGIVREELHRSGQSSRLLIVTALWKTEPSSYQEASRNVASVVFSTYPRVKQADRVVVRVLRGYDIGIARGWRGEWDSLTPQEWRVKLGAK